MAGLVPAISLRVARRHILQYAIFKIASRSMLGVHAMRSESGEHHAGLAQAQREGQRVAAVGLRGGCIDEQTILW
jgi:hypothetical protein